ncbi:hypothetical protein AG1IA_09166 [Rhizoctonia solani AG-1 IA]|uniref:Uncharacterized protein n=1 Tax=Thanatephorus cucumeris (strain AG1-IA) TaxID=983506 RepID=L8WKC9_THACA|nr:hypothetical protein AG1IA_09166 [Rhizoctonia solani AG-1 IA]
MTRDNRKIRNTVNDASTALHLWPKFAHSSTGHSYGRFGNGIASCNE